MIRARIWLPIGLLAFLALLEPSSAHAQMTTPGPSTGGQPGGAGPSRLAGLPPLPGYVDSPAVRRAQVTPGDTPTNSAPNPNATPNPNTNPNANTNPPSSAGTSPGDGGQPSTTNPGGADPTSNDLALPRAEREGGGGEPTTAAEAQDKPEATTPDETKLLMKLLHMKEDSPTKVFGWLQNSFTGNTNGRPKNDLNFGVNPNNLANTWMGNQYYIVIERLVRQDDSINFGFRIDSLFGNDAQFNHAQGIFNRAFKLNTFAQYDPAQYYAEVHLPWFTEGGLDIKGGRFYAIAGYEVVPATGRPLLSVPYMFNYGQPFTHSGMLSTLHLTKNVNIYNGAINGWDRQFNEHYTWGYVGGFSANSEDGKMSLATTYVWGPNQFNTFLPLSQNPIYPTGVVPPPPQFAGKRNPGYNSNDRNLFTTVLSYKWSDKLTQVMETDQAWETNVPFALGNQDGFNRHNAQWYSFGNWFLYKFNDKFTGVWRSEIFRDNNGVRTGTAADYCEFTVGGIYKPKPYIWIRPEARYDFTNGPKVYNDNTRNSQLTLAFDIIFLF